MGVPVDMVDYEEALARFKTFVEEDGVSLIVTPNSEIVVNAGKNEELMEAIKQAEMVIPDGIGLVYASKILGHPLRERVTGIDFLGRALAYLAETGKTAFLFGSKPGIAEKAAARMEQAYPGLKIVGTRNGYFKEEEEEGILREINEAAPDLLCVALGSPKQELFVLKYKDRLNAKAAIGIGGSLDVWSGDLKRAPEFYRKHGLEWLYRFIQEPSRYKRMAALPLFMLKVIFSNKSQVTAED
ncbi:MAG: WecB/TagA/CpsF family glycosyltransferase [Firmicutes bacterium]|nr:WecB/TagA/CpsF family glycosyltransferase [Bacillota bacterium]